MANDLPFFTEEAASKPTGRTSSRPRPARVARTCAGHAGQTCADLGRTEHRIDLRLNAITVHQAPYRAGPLEREFERSELARMSSAGVIRPSVYR